MTLDQATKLATRSAAHWHKPFVVFRLPMWPTGCFSVVPQDRGLPPTTIIACTVQPPLSTDLFDLMADE